jgi:hypothetical protein
MTSTSAIDTALSHLVTLPVPEDRKLRRTAIAMQVEAAATIAGFSPRAVLAAAIEALVEARQELRARKAAGADVKAALNLNGARIALLVDAHDVATDSGVFSRGRALAVSQERYRAEEAAAAASAQSDRLSAGLNLVAEELGGIRELLAKLADKP